MVYIERLRFADERPIVIETCCFPIHFAYLLDEDLDNSSMYGAIRCKDKDLKIVVKSGTRTIRLILANEETAKLLQLKPGTALLTFEGVCYDQNDKPVHTTYHIGYSQKYDFSVTI